MSILLFFLVLFVLILVHELGHFVVAKYTGMKVEEFGIGLPPKLFGIKKGETEYTLNLLPIGGFVKILGENLEQSDSVQDRHRSFASKNKWAQAAVLVAGVVMNVVFAWILFVAIFMIGVTSAVDEVSAGPDAKLVAAEILSDTPADLAGLPTGANIISVRTTNQAAEDLLTPTSFREFLAMNEDEQLTIEYLYKEELSQVTMVSQTGLIEGSDAPAVGVSLVMVDKVAYSFVGAVFEATKTTEEALKAITVGISTLLFDILTLDADLSAVAGPVGIVGLVGEAAQFGLVSLLTFTAFISLNLAVINMLPVPALDGGRLVFVGIEVLIRRPINPIWMVRVNMIGFALLLTLMAAVTYSDIAKML